MERRRSFRILRAVDGRAVLVRISPRADSPVSFLLIEETDMVESAQLEHPATTDVVVSETKPGPSTRLVSLDAFRELVMTLMLAEVMRLPQVASAFPHSLFWRIIGFNTEHVDWQGCS